MASAAADHILPAAPTPIVAELPSMQPSDSPDGQHACPAEPTKPLPRSLPSSATPNMPPTASAPPASGPAALPQLQTAEVAPSSTASSAAASPTNSSDCATSDAVSRPVLARASTEPASPSSPASASSPTSGLGPRLSLPFRPRNRSPFTRSHLRSRSAASSLSGGSSMTRAQSSPTADSFLGPSGGAAPLHARPASPHLASTPRRASPLRRPLEDVAALSAATTAGFASGLVDIDQTIAEHSELNIAPRPPPDWDTATTGSAPSPLTPSSPYAHATFPRASARRRPSSPLQHLLPAPLGPPPAPGAAGAALLQHSTSTPALRSGAATPPPPALVSSATMPATGTSGGSSGSSRYNEAYPGAYAPSVSTAGSSVPSTPTSFRSRSPSISSLETIPDSPDAETAAERDADELAAAGAAGAGGGRRGSFEGNRGRGLLRDGGAGGVAGGAKDRKRWSVCGAERRGDLDLETIWED